MCRFAHYSIYEPGRPGYEDMKLASLSTYEKRHFVIEYRNNQFFMGKCNGDKYEVIVGMHAIIDKLKRDFLNF